MFKPPDVPNITIINIMKHNYKGKVFSNSKCWTDCSVDVTWLMLTLDNILFVLCWSRNLQAAIGAYYDCESPNINTPSMSFVEDVTIGEGESVPPDTPFTKTWRIQNTGTCQCSYPFPEVMISVFIFLLTEFIFVNCRCRVVAAGGLS